MSLFDLITFRKRNIPRSCRGSMLLKKKERKMNPFLTSETACDLASLIDSAMVELDLKPF